MIKIKEGGVWKDVAKAVDLTTKQDKSALVTTINASSTNETYPSAKAAYNNANAVTTIDFDNSRSLTIPTTSTNYQLTENGCFTIIFNTSTTSGSYAKLVISYGNQNSKNTIWSENWERTDNFLAYTTPMLEKGKYISFPQITNVSITNFVFIPAKKVLL